MSIIGNALPYPFYTEEEKEEMRLKFLNQMYAQQQQQAMNTVQQGKGLGGYGGYNVQLGTNTISSPFGQQVPQYTLEAKEREAERMLEREACVKLVMDMAEELNCPNLLHGVALAIKARRNNA